MQGYVYNNSITIIPGWAKDLHESHELGYAYETNDRFIHIYGRDSGWYVQSTGLTATMRNAGPIQDWIKNVFGGQSVQTAANPVGHAVKSVWRPGLHQYDQTRQALDFSVEEQRSSAQALRVLLEKLNELLLYVEPGPNGLKSYSHKTREFLILSCTEVENSWQHHLKSSGYSSNTDFNTNDYVKLKAPLHLEEYEIQMLQYSSMIPPLVPFASWDDKSPSQSLVWYDAYNKTKHNREAHFQDATLINCIQSMAANIAMYCVRYGPYSLFRAGNTTASLANEMFTLSLLNPDIATFYIPSISLPSPDEWSLEFICAFYQVCAKMEYCAVSNIV